MKVSDAIARANALRPGNSIPTDIKRAWLTEFDYNVLHDVIMPHAGDIPEYSGYTDSDDAEMLIPDSHAEVYPDYLVAKIDQAQGEVQRYNTSASQFEESYSAYRKWYNRNHAERVNVKLRNTGRVRGI